MSDDYFSDLSDYTRQIAPFRLVGVKNVGWINVRSDFPTGELPGHFVERLKNLVQEEGVFRPLVEPIRETPICEICGPIELLNTKGNQISNSELWIPSPETIYASPISILHFIEIHHYRPPQEYVDAVNNLDTNLPYVADEKYREKLRQSEWFQWKRRQYHIELDGDSNS